MSEMLSRLTARRGIRFGGDYNPEQWPRSVWQRDVELMREAGVDLVTVGVFSWSTLEPRPGELHTEWLHDVLDLLHGAGIGVDLATPVASPPPWLGHLHPETLPVTEDGTVLSYGSRNQFCPHSLAYRHAAESIARRVVGQLAGHPAIELWHIGNEYGQVCHCDEAARDFRGWLQDRYGSLEGLNEAWSTTVWSQGYGDWDEVLPPRAAPYHRNPAQGIDFRRFTSDALLARFGEQRAIIRAHDRETPLTTNLMGFFHGVDSQEWSRSLEIIADDAYPDPADPHAAADAALVAGLNRGLADGGPWMRMEQAASAVSWRPHNLTKSPARLRAESLQAVAHGSDALCFFQWRQARVGPERFHSSMLPVAGEDSDVFRGIVRLGRDVKALEAVVGASVHAEVALLWSWPSWWMGAQEALPTDRLDPHVQITEWHRTLWGLGVHADVRAPSDDLSQYKAVLVPALMHLDDESAERLRHHVEAGGVLVWGPFCGVADAHAGLHTGRAPVQLSSLLGISSEEWVPLPDGGSRIDGPELAGHAHVLGERARADDAQIVAAYGEGPLAGCAAITRRRSADGVAWFLGAGLDEATRESVLSQALDDAGVATYPARPSTVEAVLRGEVLVVTNHADDDVVLEPHRDLPVTLGRYRDLLDGTVHVVDGSGPWRWEPWQVRALARIDDL